MDTLLMGNEEPSVLTIYNQGWGRPVGLVTSCLPSDRSAGGVPDYVQLGKAQNLGILVPYPQLRLLLIATRLCLQTNPHNPEGYARKAVIALMINLGAGAAKSKSARALSAALIKAARPDCYLGFSDIIESWDIDIGHLRFWDNVVYTILKCETQINSRVHKVKYIQQYARSLDLKSVITDEEAICRMNKRLKFLHMPVPLLCVLVQTNDSIANRH